MTPAEHLQAYREKVGLTQAQLARLAGIHRTVIAKVEAGISKRVATEPAAKLEGASGGRLNFHVLVGAKPPKRRRARR